MVERTRSEDEDAWEAPPQPSTRIDFLADTVYWYFVGTVTSRSSSVELYLTLQERGRNLRRSGPEGN